MLSKTSLPRGHAGGPVTCERLRTTAESGGWTICAMQRAAKGQVFVQSGKLGLLGGQQGISPIPASATPDGTSDVARSQSVIGANQREPDAGTVTGAKTLPMTARSGSRRKRASRMITLPRIPLRSLYRRGKFGSASSVGAYVAHRIL